MSTPTLDEIRSLLRQLEEEYTRGCPVFETLAARLLELHNFLADSGNPHPLPKGLDPSAFKVGGAPADPLELEGGLALSKETTQVVLQLLKERDPMHYTALAEALIARGYIPLTTLDKECVERALHRGLVHLYHTRVMIRTARDAYTDRPGATETDATPRELPPPMDTPKRFTSPPPMRFAPLRKDILGFLKENGPRDKTQIRSYISEIDDYKYGAAIGLWEDVTNALNWMVREGDLVVTGDLKGPPVYSLSVVENFTVKDLLPSKLVSLGTTIKRILYHNSYLSCSTLAGMLVLEECISDAGGPKPETVTLAVLQWMVTRGDLRVTCADRAHGAPDVYSIKGPTDNRMYVPRD